MTNAKISIITICFNAVNYMEKTILSVINQTYPNIEYIVIDGGSTDGTVDIIKKYADKISYWVSEPDKGIYDAMNKGIKAATGYWINFMNAGDVFLNNNVLNNIIQYIDNSADIIYGDLVYDTPIGIYWKKPEKLENIKNKMVFGHQASFINTKYHKTNKYDATYRSSGDYAFFYNAYMNKAIFKYVPIKIALFDAKSGMSNDNFYIVNLENLKIHGKDHFTLSKITLFIKYIIWRINRTLKRFMIKHHFMINILNRRMENNGYIKLLTFG